MKKSLLTTLLFLSVFLGSSVIAKSQVVVKYKPVKARVIITKPVKIRTNRIWVKSHWQWKKSTHSYVWVKGHYVKKRKGYNYNQGYWLTITRKGHRWVLDYWSRA